MAHAQPKGFTTCRLGTVGQPGATFCLAGINVAPYWQLLCFCQFLNGLSQFVDFLVHTLKLLTVNAT